LTLHLIETKSPWGGIYQDDITHQVIDTEDKVYWKAWHKYEDVRKVIQSKLKPTFNGRIIQVKIHILCVSFLGAFNQKATTELSYILETNTRKIISMWGKRIVAPAIKGSFNIWLKKNGWSNFTDRPSLRIRKEIDDVEEGDLDTDQMRADYKTEMTQIALVQNFPTVNEPDLSLQEEVDIDFAPDDNEEFLHDKYEEDMELAEYTLIPKDIVFDPPEDVEETELLRYHLTDLTSKESMLTISITACLTGNPSILIELFMITLQILLIFWLNFPKMLMITLQPLNSLLL
jgi:hypothetical protein